MEKGLSEVGTGNKGKGEGKRGERKGQRIWS